jgi:UDP-N-acetylglucosamine 4-epimerase
VIPKWIAAMIRNEIVFVNGDGKTSRDFCYIENATQAIVLAATTSIPGAVNQVYNVGANARTSLNQFLCCSANRSSRFIRTSRGHADV